MTGHILVATDLSPRSDRALRRASMIARQLGAELLLVHVVDDERPRHLVKAQIAATLPVLQEAARTIQQFDGIAAAARVVTGDPSTAILEVADRSDADLIILGPHRSRLRDVFVGTTAERTIAQTCRPVLMAAGVPAGPYRRAMLAIDLDEPFAKLLERADAIGIVSPERLFAMHAFDAPARGMMKRGMADDGAIEAYLAAEEERVGARLRMVAPDAGLTGIDTRLRPITGSAARTIIETARDEHASLIIVGTSQRRGLERLMFGSTAEDVAANADRDVLVIPNRDRAGSLIACTGERTVGEAEFA